VDGTLGGGGHARRILDQLSDHGMLIGIDQDPDAITHANSWGTSYKSKITLVHDNFANLPELLAKLNIASVDGILVDLGISLYQLEGSGRGFSFQKEEALDMRMNPFSSITAQTIVNSYSEKALANLLYQYGEEKKSRQIARKICEIRKQTPITTSKQLADLVAKVLPRTKHRIHPATKTFMALRITVNQELEQLERFMDHFINCLSPGGRLCVISFHSLEDRIVKQKLKTLSITCSCPKEVFRCSCNTKPVLRIITPKAIRPTDQEIKKNPMARSALLRVAEKLTSGFS